MQKTRYDFKFLYAIGIIAVVAGHCENGGISLGYEFFPPTAFHLPLFVFVSGYFFKADDTDCMGKSILKKAKRLLLPMYLWNIVYGLFVLLLKSAGFTFGGDFNLYNLLFAPWVDGNQFGYNMGGWFLAPLFMIYLFNLCVYRIGKKRINAWLLTPIYIALGMLGIYMVWHGYNCGIGLMMVRMAYFLPFYAFGILYREKIEGKLKVNNFMYFGIILLIQLVLILMYREAKGYTYSWCNTFDNLYMPYIIPLLGILFWLRIAKIVEPIIPKCKYLLTVADNTYAIMIHQFLGFMLVKLLFGIVHNITNGRIFMAFSWESFKSDIWYYYTPGSLSQWLILYLAAGMIVPIGIQKISSLTARRLFKHKT